MGLSFAAPAFLWLLAALPLVVWWYLYRQRLSPRQVAALFLWDQALREAEQRRRWRPSWSLLLQLLAVAAAAMALAQPSLELRGPPDLIIVIDAGARMQAVDPEGQRLQRAIDQAMMLAGEAGAVALVRAGALAELVLPFSRDRGELRAALDVFEAVDANVDAERALDLARSLGAAEVAWISDDPGPERPGIRRYNVAGSGHNVGIVAFDLGIQQAFVAVSSDHDRPLGVTLLLEDLDGRLLALSDLLVPVRGTATVTFPLEVHDTMVRARLEGLDAGDALAIDDVAYAGSRALQVLLDADEPNLRRAFEAVGGVEMRVTGSAGRLAGDLRVLSGADPATLAPGDHLLMPAPVADAVLQRQRVAGWQRAHPLLRFVDLREVVVGVAPIAPVGSAEPPPWATDVQGAEAAGWTVLAHTAELRPVLAYREREGVRALALGFHPAQTDLVFRPAFPTLMANALDHFRGVPRLPLGSLDEQGRRLSQPGQVTVAGRQLSVSLLSEAQSRLPAPAPDDAEAAADSLLPIERPTPFAWILVLIAVLALALEWWAWSAEHRLPPRPTNLGLGRRRGLRT